MKTIILNESISATISFKDVSPQSSIFVKEDGKFIGMVIKEDKGWIIRMGPRAGATGHHDDLFKCLESGVTFRYTYHVESED